VRKRNAEPPRHLRRAQRPQLLKFAYHVLTRDEFQQLTQAIPMT
jgi:hypothetical protein